MKGKRIISVLLSLALLPAIGMMNVSAASGEVIRLNPADASPFNNGEFQGWGTALCWWANRIGYSDKMTKQAADLFFSDEGLGLDIARYNLGGGDDPSHNHINRSDSKVPGVWETFTLSEDGKNVESITYDITNDQNQLNIAKAALAANPDLYFEGFSNSAPYFMTVTGCTGGGDPASSDNLKADMYDDFGKFIAGATKLFKDNGIVFRSYSPMNEPDTSYWGVNSPKQEGCHFSLGESQSKAIVETRKALDAAGLTDVLVAGMDETSLKSTANNLGKLTDEAKTALGRIDTHTYSDRGYYAQVKAKAVEMNKNLWQSEVDKGGDGFTLASMIIEDMNGMQPSAWVMWDIVDFHKDSNFVDPTTGNKTEANNSVTDTSSLWGVGMADHDNENLIMTNKYYAYGQFTKYIEPGMTIIASSNNTLAAYDKKTGKIVIVALNNGTSDKKVTFDLRAFSKTGSKAQAVRTNASSEKWAPQADIDVTNKQLDATLKAKTITTYVIEGDGATDYAVITGGGNQISLGSSVTLAVNTNMEGDIEWSSSDEKIATVTQDGTVTAKDSGTVTIYAKVGDFTTSRDFEIPLYTLTGTASWGNDSSRPADSADYTKVADGDLSTYFDGTTGGWVQYDYGSTFKINQIKLSARSGNGMPERTAGGRVQGSNDGITWTDIYKITSAIPADKYTIITSDKLINKIPYRYYRYINSDNMANIAEFLIEGEPSSDMPAQISKFEADKSKLSYSYEISDDLSQYQKYFAVYDSNNKLKYISLDKQAEEVQGDFSGCTFKLFVWDDMKPMNAAVDSIEPVIADLNEFTDNFESNDNIFNAPNGAISDGGNVVFASGLDRFGNVFAPVRTTAVTALKEKKTLTKNDKFRLTFNMFAGWESNGKDNTFALKDADGNELVALYMTGGGYNFNQIRIGGKNVLAEATVAQSRSNPGSNKAGANGWNASGQPYVNTVGYNKTVEITIDGTGAVSVAATGGMADTTVTGTISKPITLGSIELTGDYNSAAERTVSYDNFDGDIITYADAFAEPEPTPEPTATPEPTDAPVLPQSGELISLNFDNGDLTSSSTYGKASGTPKFAEVDGKKCIQFDNTNNTVIKLTDANGNPLLTGQKNITVSFKVKPTVTGTSWWFYAAPNDSAQTYLQEKYLGAMTNTNKITVERYNNSGARSEAALTALQSNQWNDIMISFGDGVTDVYVNGVKASVASTVNIADMLGKNSVCYIGKANWVNGEYATGYIDDFVIYNHAIENPLGSIDLGDLSAVTADITIPAAEGVTWETSDETVITADGKVTRADDTKTATLTAKMTKDGIEFTRSFDVTVTGYTAVLDTFAAYVEGNTIYYTSDYTDAEKYNMTVVLETKLGSEEPLEKQDNQARGEFADLVLNREYYVTCKLTDKESRDVVKQTSKTFTVKNADDMEAYLFAHFVNTEGDANCEQIYFSVSEDGQTWTTLNDKKPILVSNVGEKGVRDPYILRGEDGKFFIIATDLSIYNTKSNGKADWTRAAQRGSKSIVVWESSDLVNWSEASLVKINNDNAGCTWAPEAAWDNEKQQYMVFWASVISDDSYAKYRIYRSYTSDFKTFSAPELYIEEPNAVIDTTIIDYKGVYYRFTKNEARSSITMQECTSLSGNWKDVETYNLGDMTGYEGPTIYKMNGENKWCLLLDYFSKSKGYQPFVTSDITVGNFTAGTAFTFDGTYRHGTVMPITKNEYRKLVNEYSDIQLIAEPSDMDTAANNPAMVVDSIDDNDTYYTVRGYSGGASVSFNTSKSSVLAEFTGFDGGTRKYQTSTIWKADSADSLAKHLHKGDIIIYDNERILRYSSARDAYKKLKANEAIAKTIQTNQVRNNFYFDAVKSAYSNPTDDMILDINTFRTPVDLAKVIDTVIIDMSKNIDTAAASDADWDTVISIDRDGSTIADVTPYSADTLGDYAFIRIGEKGQLQEVMLYRFTK